MSNSHPEGASAAKGMIDELKLQAWLAKAELNHPSLRKVKGEASVLAKMRDELRLQAHLGKMEAGDRWQKVEDRWQIFMGHANNEAHEVADDLQEMLRDIRNGYRELRDSE